MLTQLRIRDFAIIDELALSLAPGFNVLTGETGAGKSIIVGALGLLLGERGSVDLVRTGAERATVEGVFDIADRPDLLSALDERGIEIEEHALVLRREVTAGGRTRGWINNSPVTASVLGEVGRMLVNLHGQHEAQALLDEESQRRILDAFGGAGETGARVSATHESLVGVVRQIQSLASRKEEAQKRADYLRHLVREIDDARIVDGEDGRLEEEAHRLEHAEELRSLAAGMARALGGEENAVLHVLGNVQRSLATLQRIDPTLARLQELFDTGFYALDELSRALTDYESGVELDPLRLAEVERRRDLFYRLTKKYGPTLADVLQAAERARAELDLVDTADLDLRQLERRRRDITERLSEDAARLTARRSDAAVSLAAAVDQLLPELGMADGQAQIVLLTRDEVAASGAEDVEFRVALNKGHHARPLTRVASGGELSRVMLALKTILARLDRVPTLVFDEVDSGIGGRVALHVGDALRRVASHHQVLAITHLPQIAARAHHHITVAKGARGGVTTADTLLVSGEARVTELARMLGGDPESDVSRAHARELLGNADPLPADDTAPATPAIDTSRTGRRHIARKR
ncbi:MAG: DNA repair protein RecN [Gemmatimonadaceae bacterium]